MLSLKEQYETIVRPKMMKEVGYSNVHQVPRIEKICLNMGLGLSLQDKGVLEAASKGLGDISGQKPCLAKAKKSIAGFKLRQGMPVGLKVTIRGMRAYEFLQRLIVVAMPRIRDFRGVSPKSFDGRGNFSMGIKEHQIFPEIDYDRISDILGMNIVINTTASTDDEARMLLRELGIPFKD